MLDECTASSVIDPAPRGDLYGGTEIVSKTVEDPIIATHSYRHRDTAKDINHQRCG
jgi:hypothetical protein